MKKSFIAYLLAVLSTYVTAVVLVSQFNLARITEMGFAVSLADRFGAMGHDLVGMLGLYLPIIAVALLIGLSFTAFVLLRFINKPDVLYPLAGFVALITVHLLMYSLLGMSGIAPTRTLAGLLSQGFAGAVGGYVFARVRAK